jgi:hypothetical protein
MAQRKKPLYAKVLLSLYKDLGLARPKGTDPASLLAPLLWLLASEEDEVCAVAATSQRPRRRRRTAKREVAP